MMGYLLSFWWGLAEATLFFVVPDVGLSVIALNDRRRGVIACLYALAGAMVGGTIMFFWGRADLAMVNSVLEAVPAIRPMDIERVRFSLLEEGVTAVLFGPIRGIPYKIYATHAHLITSIVGLLLITIPARLIRFLFVTLLTSYATNKVLPNVHQRRQLQALSLFWIVSYTIYFLIKGW